MCPQCSHSGQRMRTEWGYSKLSKKLVTNYFLSRAASPYMKTLWGPTLEQPFPEGLNPVERTHAGEGHEELQHTGRTHVGEVRGDCPPSKRRVWRVHPMRRKEVQPSLIPCPPVPLAGRRQRTGIKVKPQKKWGVGEVSLRFEFCFLLPYTDLIVIKLNRFPQVESVLLMTVIAKWSLLTLISAHQPFPIFSLPCPDDEGSDRPLLVGTSNPARVNSPHSAIQSMHSHGNHIDLIPSDWSFFT